MPLTRKETVPKAFLPIQSQEENRRDDRSSGRMHQRFSSDTSRSATPEPSARMQKQVRIQLSCFSRYTAVLLFGLATFVAFGLAIASMIPYKFCPDGVQSKWCAPCPNYANCTDSVFECAPNAIKNRKTCIPVDDLNEHQILTMHELIAQQIAKGELWNVEHLMRYTRSLYPSISEVDSIAALVYNNKFYIEYVSGSPGIVLARPRPTGRIMAWLVAALCLICFAGSIEANVYRNLHSD